MVSKKKIGYILIVIFLIFHGLTVVFSSADSNTYEEFTIVFQKFRYLEEECEDDAMFRIECVVADKRYESPKLDVSYFGKDINWSITKIVPSSQRVYTISISLYKSVNDHDILCDLSPDPHSKSAEIVYSLNTGWWIGDDYHGDLSGYGRLNGCDDGSIYDFEDDAELWFAIRKTTPDGDGIPSWIEINEYGTDPFVDDRGTDYDNDGIPTEWEWYFGYHPKEWDDHENLDMDNDGLSNLEEFLTWGYGSDPFRPDIFLEIDCMAESPTGESSLIPEEAIEMIHYPFHRRNYVIHVNRSDIIPFIERMNLNDLLFTYQQYFLQNDLDNWKRGVFHYAVYVYETFPKGFAFSGDVEPYMGYHQGTNAFVISSSSMEHYARWFPQSLAYYYASVTMHELGHNFGFRWGNPFGVDAQLGKYPWQPMYYVYRNYKSIMNYRYTYKIFDYSDGTNGFLDHDDWSALDLTYFLVP
ncbi:MAG: hypothetical protein QCI00_00930 [Candidatus Thermoplasmatota archaeon]|nr:hypothetical protein [Candidatus Thermoplasmatota archaeon]